MQTLLPAELDFEGQAVRFIIETGWTETDLQMVESIYVEEDSGDIVNSAVYHRNEQIKEYLNASIEVSRTVKPNKMKAALQTDIAAGSCDYEVIGGYQAYSVSLSATGMLRSMDDIPHLDLTEPQWPTTYLDAISYKVPTGSRAT